MACRKTLTSAQWIEVFKAFVDDATQEFGKRPCLSLEEEGNGAELIASVTIRQKTKTILGGFGQITNRDSNDISVHVYREEIPIVLELLREYQQPEPDFDGNLDYWEEVV
jgi:hypothetical protein